MAHTIFILGTDPRQCKELKEILKVRMPDNVVMANDEDLPVMKGSDAIIITSEETNTGFVYRRLLNKLEEQTHRAELLSQLIRLFSSSLQTEELLDRVVTKSTEVLGDTSFVVLSGDIGQVKLEAAFSKDRDRLTKLLLGTVNLDKGVLTGDLLSDVLLRRKSVII